MKALKFVPIIILLLTLASCKNQDTLTDIKLYESNSKGFKLKKIKENPGGKADIFIKLSPEKKYQKILGFGGSFTESSSYLLNKMSQEKRKLILEAYFGKDGTRYSLTRTHINSCDFSLSNYSYAPVEGDTALTSFSIDEDRNDIIPMIKDAMAVSEDGFRIISSPWTAPPWMKDNNDWKGGKLLPKYYDTWALFFSKYLKAYADEGIKIWGITVENEPLGNGNNWESMHYTPAEMLDFVNKHLGPQLADDHHNVKILAYDQNRGDELIEWAKVIYNDQESSKYFDGFAVHWYASTYDCFPESLEFTHEMAKDKFLINTEACVDAEVPHWNDDQWYWSKEATDWGWDWAPEEQKKFHPKYVPVYRYARDIIGCLNSHVNGWIDWNMVLDKQGGPNWANNWCTAPVIVDPLNDEAYFTPLYYTLSHFSKFIRPGAVRIGWECSDEELMLTAVQNPDNSIVIVVLNMSSTPKNIEISFMDQSFRLGISAEAIQTIVI